MDRGSEHSGKKQKKIVPLPDEDEDDDEDEAENDLVSSLERRQSASAKQQRSRARISTNLLPSWLKRTSKRVTERYESFTESSLRHGDSWSISSYRNMKNLPFLVQMMQPGMDAETVQEDEGRRVSSSPSSVKQSQQSLHSPTGSSKSRSSHRTSLQGILTSEGDSDDDEDMDEEEEETEDDDLIEDSESEDEDGQDVHTFQGDSLLGRSLRVNPKQKRNNRECFMDHLMEHVANSEEDNRSLLLVEDVEEEEDGDEEEEEFEGKLLVPVPNSRTSTRGPSTNGDIEGGRAGFTNEGDEGGNDNSQKSQLNVTPKASERSPLLGGTNRSKRGLSPKGNNHSKSKTLRLRRQSTLKHRRTRTLWRRLHGKWVAFCNIIRPREVLISAKNFLLGTFLLLMVPLVALACLLFYKLGNPELQFLPNNATLAWYLLLAVRWLVTLTLARITQYFLLVITIRKDILALWAGPFVTLMAMQSIGWPFLCFSWGIWNLLILHGKAVFCKHWLFFTGIALFSPEENPDGDKILESDLYGRILVAMIGVGFASGLKRTIAALYLSRRMLIYYGPQLKEMMFQIKLVTGVAGLAAETKKPGFGTIVYDAVNKATQVQIERQAEFMNAVPTFEAAPAPEPKGHVSKASDVHLMDVAKVLEAPSRHVKAPKGIESDSDTEDSYDDQTDSSDQEGRERLKKPPEQHADASSRSAIGHVMAKIESWDPPVDKRSRREEPTLRHIVDFKVAISFMDDDFPFSRAYGPCNSRINCIRSALRVYRRLLKFIPQDEEPTLLYDVIEALAFNQNGEWSEKRAIGLRALFTPDKDNRLSRNAFAQACDNVYKKMLFLRASMNNSSKIDGVLEDIFDWFFHGILAVIVLSLLGLDIWPLLVSFSTMLLSFTFAFSSSTARTVEGIMLIFVRRPFDIGDRITISSTASAACPGPGNAWLVEDIDLTTTTLKYIATNEVCTINNSTLTHNRIVNFNRSPKASMTLLVRFTIDATHKQIERFRRRVQKYLKNRPRSWDALVFFRNKDLHKLDGYITYMLGVRSTQPWQNPSVFAKKAKLELMIDNIATQLGILYVRRPNRMEVEITNETDNPQSESSEVD